MYLSHAKKHKYIDKVRIGDGWRYFYTQAELDAYRKIQNAKKELARKKYEDAYRVNKKEQDALKRMSKADITKELDKTIKEQRISRGVKERRQSYGDTRVSNEFAERDIQRSNKIARLKKELETRSMGYKMRKVSGDLRSKGEKAIKNFLKKKGLYNDRAYYVLPNGKKYYVD